MEENNVRPKTITSAAEILIVALGLALLLIVPFLYNLKPPSVNPGAGSFSNDNPKLLSARP